MFLGKENNSKRLQKVKKCGHLQYGFETVLEMEGQPKKNGIGEKYVYHDISSKKWRLIIQLDEKRYWFLSVFFDDNGMLEKFSLDYEGGADDHYEFVDEVKIREKLYVSGDESRFLGEIFAKYIEEYGANRLLNLLEPYITAQFHYD